MAIVEDEMRNDSEEENEIEVVVEEDDGDQDSGDDDSDDEEDDEVLEAKVQELEKKISEDPYNYDNHMELIQALWSLSELDRWRAAFERLHQLSVLRPEHWLLRLQTEISLAHSEQARDRIDDLFEQASLDCYSIPILSEWFPWSLGAGEISSIRSQTDELLRRAGADPLSGKLLWDSRVEVEKAQAESISEEDPSHLEQLERVLFCLEETVSRPLLRAALALPSWEELAVKIRDKDYIERVKKQHEVAVEYLDKVTPYEDKLLTLEDPEEKAKVYQEYIETVKELSRVEKYAECDSDGILKVLYDRATTELTSPSHSVPLLKAWCSLTRARSSRSTWRRVLNAACRRQPQHSPFWKDAMYCAERDDKGFDEVKSILETALSKGPATYKDSEELWLCYLEFTRRQTDFSDDKHKERLRATFRLAWDSLAESWGSAADDSEVALYWARLEYTRLQDHLQGKEIFEEIFKYGENKTMSKYWESFINLERHRSPPPSENKLRDLHKRALKFVSDYPPAVARLWIDFERDVGTLETMRSCVEACEAKVQEWRDNYQAMKEKMSGQKSKYQKPNQNNKPNKKDNKKGKQDSKSPVKGKRKAEDSTSGTDVKKKRDSGVVVEEKDKDDYSAVLKRTHGEDDEGVESKRSRLSSEPQDREACTLFVSNLEFKVDEPRLRETLSQFGDIVSLRLRAGVKAFGGSICYCQYTDTESVDKALKHDRMPLDGRPMFFSRYSSNKGKQTFKYSTTTENNKLFVKNLPYSHCNKEALSEVFDKYGKVQDIRVVTFKDGKPKGLAYIEYADASSAAAAVSGAGGLRLGGREVEVAISAPPPRANPTSELSLGAPKRDGAGGMRRTQLSSFIPRVLQKAAVVQTSASTSNGSSNGDAHKPAMSNTDFRNMLLNKP